MGLWQTLQIEVWREVPPRPEGRLARPSLEVVINVTAAFPELVRGRSWQQSLGV